MPNPEWIEVFAPATVGNVGPGYDVLGLAVDAPGDRVRARRAEPGVHLTKVDGDDGTLPPAGPNNTASVAARGLLAKIGVPWGVELELYKGLPVGSGLGSSGASAAAAAVAVNLLSDDPLPVDALIDVCATAEAAACGAPHRDNIAPALLGGIVLVPAGERPVVVQTGLDLVVALLTPDQSLATRDARAAIPAAIPVADVVHNAGQLASAVYALSTDDPALLGRSLSDHIAEPRRAALIPGFAAVKAAALDAGALGASISGAGPTMFALCLGKPRADAALAAMVAALSSAGGRSIHRAWTAAVSPSGAHAIGAAHAVEAAR